MSHNSLVERRIRYVVAISLVLLIAFAVRLIDVQAVRAAGYANRADMELAKRSLIMAPRGAITDINGVEFARSVIAYRILADQAIIDYPNKLAELAAPILKMDAKELENQLTGTRRYVVISQSEKPAVWRKLEAAVDSYNAEVSKEKNGYAKRLAGFFAERIYVREYPEAELGAAVIGFINRAGAGAAGLEYSMNSTLSGINGEYTYANAGGTIIPGTQKITSEAIRGNTIRLTIDRDVQWVAQEAIRTAVKGSRALSGTVIVMDPKTGHILAHATYPSFTPGNTKGVDPYRWKNPSVQEVYEPGSTGKIITVASAIEEGKIAPETVLTVPYKLKRSNKVFSDHDPHPVQRLTVSGALAVSSNTASIKIGEMLSNDKLHSYLKKFGIGEKSESGLPGEESGKLLDVKDWSGTTAPTVAFGQGYSVTAMQATSVFATIANDGVRVTPTVVAGISDAAGRYTPANKQKSLRVVSAETAQKMRLMMESVVSPTGTAPTAAIPGYRVAGKTGTAQRVDDSCGCYRGYTASFIGFAPADKPEFVVSVTIQDPKGLHWGGYLGGPVFKKVMSFVLKDQHVPPTLPAVNNYALDEKELKAKIAAAEAVRKQQSRSGSNG
ncbi:MAG: penicillin-binding protein 2 [Candidatus Nanopelagicaceae bacterium]|nr:penicillin-binding protein 2 [Candidatus Nanopelagicaceae bacterium]